jgi:hypothetical protein
MYNNYKPQGTSSINSCFKINTKNPLKLSASVDVN